VTYIEWQNQRARLDIITVLIQKKSGQLNLNQFQQKITTAHRFDNNDAKTQSIKNKTESNITRRKIEIRNEEYSSLKTSENRLALNTT